MLRSRSVVMWMVGLCTVAWAAAASAQSLRETLKDIDIAPHWIYDDLPRALDQARATGKPLLVVLRCVPCPPGRSLDMQVMKPAGALADLQQEFVCVRVIQTKGLDLSLFQYDFDMSWSAVFMNADRIIYGRYGTRSAGGPQSDEHLAIESFTKATRLALALHQGYPGNKDQLLGKLPSKAPDYARPELTPGLEDRAVGATTRQSCIHCHMVKEYALRAKWQAGTLSLADLWVYPMPEQIGLTIDDRDGRVVREVTSGSPAAQAGFEKGDELLRLNGQPLISVADIQWVLHNVPADTTLDATVRRSGADRNLRITLEGNWKKSDIAWRASSWYGLRQGLKLEPLAEAERARHGLEARTMGLLIKGLFGKGAAPLKAAGLRVGDVVVAMDGQSDELTEGEFLTRLRLEHGPRDAVRLTILRDGRRHDKSIPLW
ncbi:MAG: Trx7/PDZ domain-containing (seleno)protein [Pirellulaceae bacterium]